MIKTKPFIITFVIGCIVYVIGNLYSGFFAYNSVRDFLADFGFYQLYAFVLGYSNLAFFNYMENRQWQQSNTLKRIVIGITGSVIITLTGLFLLRAFKLMVVYGYSYQQFINNSSWSGYAFGFWITLIIVSIFHIVFFYNRYQKNKLKEQKVIAGTASAKFDALKNQLDPHFLFNSLNVLTSLIEENPKAAQKFTTSLSKVYRYVLEQKNKDLVTVAEELDFAKTYMDLLKMRFEDSIVFEIPEKASNPESKVVPLSLQLLLENAVKHNMVTTTKPLHISIYEDQGYLVVLNNLQPKQIVKKSSGVGLENIKQRYKLLTNKTVIINKRAKDFVVAIPMLTKQVSVMRRTSDQQLSDAYVRARKHVDELKGFYYSVISYVIVIPILIFIWYKFSRYTIQWFWFPVIFWGLSNVVQAYRLFVNKDAFGAKWEQRKIEEYMRQEENNNKWS